LGWVGLRGAMRVPAGAAPNPGPVAVGEKGL
jgi:hypothetical protein